MATYVIAVKVVRDDNNNPIEPEKQYYTFMSRYDSFINNNKLSLEFKFPEAAVSWWDSFKRNHPNYIETISQFVDLNTLSVRQRKVSYKLTEKLTI